MQLVGPGAGSEKEGIPSLAARHSSDVRSEMLLNLPAELRALPTWACANADKVPVDPRTGRAASSTDPSTWCTFDEALKAKQEGRFLYVGIMLDGTHAVIDQDNKPTSPATAEQLTRHAAIREHFNSYTERSCSGTGFHTIVRGSFEGPGRNLDHVEVYCRARFMVCTGDVFIDAPVAERPELLALLVKEIGGGSAGPRRTLVETDETADDIEILTMASEAGNGEKFKLLFNGRWTDDPSKEAPDCLYYKSQSEADLALLSILAFYTRSNAQVRSLFRSSKLGQREKAMKNDKYLDQSLAKIRNSEPPQVEVSGSLAKVNGATVEWEEAPDDRPEPEFPREALYGPAGEFVKWVEGRTEAHPAGVLVHFLARFGAAVGRGPHFHVSGDLHHARLWPCLVGMTGYARKGLAAGVANHPFKALVDPDLKLSTGLSSGEGLIFHLQQTGDEVINPLTAFARLEYKRRMFIQESEFARVLMQNQRTGNTLSDVLRVAWDGGTLSVMTKNNPLLVEGAHVVLTAHITREELRRQLAATELANGFANRFFWVFVKRQGSLSNPAPLVDLDRSWTEWMGRRITEAQKCSLMQRSPAAEEAWKSLYDELTRERRGIVGQLLVRGAPYVMRIAMTLALLDGQTQYIDVPHLLAAKALWDYSIETTKWVWGDMTGDPTADRILEALRRSPTRSLTRNEIGEMFGSRNSGQVLNSLNLLLDLRRVRRGKTKPPTGRPVEIWQMVE